MKVKLIILLVLGGIGILGVGGLLFLGAVVHYTKGPPKPGEAEFDKADQSIAAFSPQQLSGNNEEAKAMATKYNTYLKLLISMSFTKQGGTGKVPTDFKIYCQKSNAGVVFLVNVPELRAYKDDVRVSLAGLCWRSAQQVLGEDPNVQLGVGLRGRLLYGSVQTGLGKGAPIKMTDNSTELFYPFFAASTGPAPSKPVSETTPPAAPASAPTVSPAPSTPEKPKDSDKPIPPPKNF